MRIHDELIDLAFVVTFCLFALGCLAFVAWVILRS